MLRDYLRKLTYREERKWATKTSCSRKENLEPVRLKISGDLIL
jgi:hypothetical protein